MAKPYWKFIYVLGGATLVAAYVHAAPTPVTELADNSSQSKVTTIKLGAQDVSQRELTCLAQAIYFEARGESMEGQRAVGNVVLNRVADPRFPKTVCGVVFQHEHWRHKCQFSFACDGLTDDPPDTRAWHRAQKLAETMMTGKRNDDTGHATHYHANYVQPTWASSLEPTVDIGHHLFYREDSPSDEARTSIAAVTPQS